MKLKYYLRGIGTATIVIVLILSLSGGKKESLSDAEIRERAMQLGMVDATSLTLTDVQTGKGQSDAIENVEQPVTKPEAQQNTEEEQMPSVSEEETVQEGEASGEAENQPEEEGVQEVLPEQKEEEEQENPTEPEEEAVPESPEEQESAAPQVFYETGSSQEEPITIVIQSGVGSYTVSRVLAEAGLVADAGEFDRYLCNIGYSRVINTGTYEIMPGTSEEEIAKIITRNR